MSGEIQARLVLQMKEAMRAKAKERLVLLRMLINDLKNEQDKLGDGKLEDGKLCEADELSVLRKAAKMRKDAADMALDAGREEMAKNELAELAIIETFLPTPLSPEETEEKLDALLAELGVSEKKETGKFMREWMSRYQTVTDGKLVQRLLTERLS